MRGESSADLSRQHTADLLRKLRALNTEARMLKAKIALAASAERDKGRKPARGRR